MEKQRYYVGEGDVSISPQRKIWAERNVSEEAKKWLAKDEKYFIHQSTSTPCLLVLVIARLLMPSKHRWMSYRSVHAGILTFLPSNWLRN